MKIVFIGDSITDMGRDKSKDFNPYAYGMGYVYVITSKLSEKNPTEHTIYNRGISSNRTIDLYSRIKPDVWALEPDVLSILVGVNDVWFDTHEVKNGLEIDRFEEMYRIIIENTLKKLPKVKIVLMEPFIELGKATEEKWDSFVKVKDYAKIVKKLAREYGLFFLPLQEKLDELSAKYGPDVVTYDGAHPAMGGIALIANEWIKLFENEIDK